MVLFDTRQSVVTIHFPFKRAVPNISWCSSTTGLWVNDKRITGALFLERLSAVWFEVYLYLRSVEWLEMLMKAPLVALVLMMALDSGCYMWTGWQRAETQGIGPGTWEYLALRATTDSAADFGAPSTCKRREGGGTFTRDTKHVCLDFSPLGTRRPMHFQDKNKS